MYYFYILITYVVTLFTRYFYLLFADIIQGVDFVFKKKIEKKTKKRWEVVQINNFDSR